MHVVVRQKISSYTMYRSNHSKENVRAARLNDITGTRCSQVQSKSSEHCPHSSMLIFGSELKQTCNKLQIPFHNYVKYLQF